MRVIKNKNNFKLGDQIQLNLMFKSKQKNFNALIMPIGVFDQYKFDINTKSSDDKQFRQNLFTNLNKKYLNCEQYFKLNCKCANDIYENVLVREKNELKTQIEEEKHQPEVCFAEEALRLLEERELTLLNEIKTTPVKVDKPKSPPLDIVERPTKVYSDAFEDILSSETAKINEITKQPSVDSITDTDDAAFSFFYQSTDGQRIYINSLNTRCLINEYKTFLKCPPVITGKIVAYDSFFMSEENRKRFKYLSHLPLHSEFKIVELDLNEPILSEETLNMFAKEIDDRKHMRLRKEIRDKRISDRAAAAASSRIESQYYHVASGMNEQPNIVDYSSNFPDYTLISGSPPLSETSLNSTQLQQAQQQQVASFAQMLKYPSDIVKDSPIVVSQSAVAWPTLDSSSSNNLSNTAAHVTKGWLPLVKQHQEQLNTRSKRYQDAPAPLTPTVASTGASFRSFQH